MLTRLSFFDDTVAPSEWRADLPHDLGDALVVVAELALLDEPCVLERPRCVEHHQDAVAGAQLVGRGEVLHRHRLATGHVDVGLYRDVGDTLGADLVDEALQLHEVDIAFEGMKARRIVRLVDDDVDEDATGALLVEPSRREVHVARVCSRRAR